MSLRNISVDRVCPDDVIHRDGDDWLVIATNMYMYGSRVLELFVERMTGDDVGQQECWAFDDLDEVVQIYESV